MLGMVFSMFIFLEIRLKTIDDRMRDAAVLYTTPTRELAAAGCTLSWGWVERGRMMFTSRCMCFTHASCVEVDCGLSNRGGGRLVLCRQRDVSNYVI